MVSVKLSFQQTQRTQRKNRRRFFPRALAIESFESAASVAMDGN